MDPRQGEYSSLAPPTADDNNGSLPQIPKVTRKSKRASYATLLSADDDYARPPSRPKSFVAGNKGENYQKLSDDYDDERIADVGETNGGMKGFRRRSGRHVSKDIVDHTEERGMVGIAYGGYEGEDYPWPYETLSSPQKAAEKDGGYGRSHAVAEEYQPTHLKQESVSTVNSETPLFKAREIPSNPYEPSNLRSSFTPGTGSGPRDAPDKDPWYLGHKFVINFSAVFSVLLVTGNLGLLFYANKFHNLPDTSGFKNYFTGNCQNARHVAGTAQLGVHTLSALFLCLTVYSATVLLSPTRSELSRAHSRYKWLSTGGILSFRNFFQTHLLRSIPAVLLLFSGVCTSFIWPFAIGVPTISGNAYNWALVGSNFFDKGAWANDTFTRTVQYWNDTTQSYWKVSEEVKVFTNPGNTLEIMQQNGKNWTRIEKEDCVTTYGVPYLSDYTDVILVATEADPTNAFLKGGMVKEEDTGMGSWGWMCGLDETHPASHCNVNMLSGELKLRANWTLGTGQYHIQYCLAKPEEKGQGKCAVGFNSLLLMGSIGLFGISSICFAIAWIIVARHRRKFKNRLLITLGNVIDSFLQERENMTRGMCLVDKSGFKWGKAWRGENWRPIVNEKIETRRMWAVVGKIKSFLIVAAYAGILGAACIGFRKMLDIDKGNGYPTGLISVFRRNFPSITLTSLAPTYPSLRAAKSPSTYLFLLSTAPQALLTIFFLAIYHLLSHIYLRREWASFSTDHQPLRTTSLPRGAQIWSWYITIPLLIQLPLIFIFAIVTYSTHVALMYLHIALGKVVTSGIAHSTNGMLFAMILLALLVIFLLNQLLRRDTYPIPVIQNCSAGVSAACHPYPTSAGEKGEDVGRYEVMWGVVPNKNRDSEYLTPPAETKDGISLFEKERDGKDFQWGGELAHASFTNAGVVGYLKAGIGYA